MPFNQAMNTPSCWQPALDHSRYLRQLFAAHPALIEELTSTWKVPLSGEALRSQLNSEPADEEALHALLRRLRQHAMARIILRDLVGNAPLCEITESMTLLAEVTTNFALTWLHRTLSAQFGEPQDRQGRPQRLMVIGMGKLGGRELNVSSDVDFIFIYPEEGETSGPRRIENFEFFSRLGKRLIAALDEITADGQVFRVDMRLRPYGDSGPLVCSLTALETYFMAQGREWERYAWIKARLLNSGENLQEEWLTAIRRIVRPFVFRKYLDFGAINAMRDLHAQIRREVAKKGMQDHIKLGPGGIREIEFIAQVYQLIRGGHHPALQIRPTLEVLHVLTAHQLIEAQAENELHDAYIFLRRLEHRLQYVDDQQTHMLPGGEDERSLIARSMGFAAWAELLEVLNAHRDRVSRHFGAIFSDPGEGEHPLTGLWLGQLDDEDELEELRQQGLRQPEEAIARLTALRASMRYRQLPAANRERLDAVGPRLIEACAATPDPDATLARGLRFLESISRRGAYLALLQQYPLALKRVADLMGASSWAADYLTQHPLLLDELLDPRVLETATDWPAFRADLKQHLAHHADDVERQMDILREMHHAQVFRLLVQDLAGLHTIERISDHLTELADIILQETLPLIWNSLKTRHCAHPRFAVIGYGKLGGKELGYVADLDLVFLYDDGHPEAPENYAKLARRLATWLSTQTAAGMLFETDFRLRPNGESGLLAVSIDAFRDYQLEKAWVWEHQALTRARFCAGDAEIGQRFEAIRCEVLCRPRDLASLKQEVLAMRQKMLEAHASRSSTHFDLKQDRGGLIDVEFIVQTLVLGYAHQHPQLTGNLGNIALLRMAAELGLIPAGEAEGARTAYREYRRQQHINRLNDHPDALIERTSMQGHIEAVNRLWQTVFGQAVA